MSNTVPTISSDLPGLQLGTLSGFRGQEDWGRWTLGKVTSVELKAKQAGWVGVQLNFVLPYPQQRLSVFFNGHELTTLKTVHQYQKFDLALPLNFLAGRNELRLVTDKSNLDPRLKPFAPLDLSDMAVSLNQLELAPLQVFTQTHPGRIYDAVQPPYPLTYQQVLNRQIDFFIRTLTPQTLNYRLLSSTDQQIFSVRLGGQVLHTMIVDRRGTLISGQLPLKVSGEIQHLRIISSPSDGQRRANDSLSTIEKYNGVATFYVQKLEVTPAYRWQKWEQPLAGLSVLLGLGLLLWLLFKKRCVSVSKRLI